MEIKTVTLNNDDILVFQSEDYWTNKVMEHVSDRLKAAGINNKLIFLDRSTNITVLKKANNEINVKLNLDTSAVDQLIAKIKEGSEISLIKI
ncbi:hypothetical protein [Thermoactinomyces sp. CICC 10521]|uniref:hypothetical protein n=1 Tax=Thermoactinomyces sp. CICC 10521 TaxID=2767426 RepID=UPI0018DC91E0|nr:hypothetical protein [Thermoactinomyces sp. CICC 10521]MBH8609107.1 hypothetical protein [Thermoactinomyces sp. CICC 10521]